MKNPLLLPASVLLLFLSSCASMHKSGVTEESIPGDIHQGKYQTLYTELNFDNTVSKNVSKVHNNAAKKFVEKKTGQDNLFINEEMLNKGEYADVNKYRFVLVNRITHKLTKTYSSGGKSTSHISGFYFLDRKTGKEYPQFKGSTMPLYMLKAIVEKIED